MKNTSLLRITIGLTIFIGLVGFSNLYINKLSGYNDDTANPISTTKSDSKYFILPTGYVYLHLLNDSIINAMELSGWVLFYFENNEYLFQTVNLKTERTISDCNGEEMVHIFTDLDKEGVLVLGIQDTKHIQPLNLKRIADSLLTVEQDFHYIIQTQNYEYNFEGRINNPATDPLISEEDLRGHILISSPNFSPSLDTISNLIYLRSSYSGFKLRWVGMIDTDTIPDFILSLPISDNQFNYTLFLSSAADKGKLLKQVACFNKVEDC